MDRYERILAIHRLLKSARYPISMARLQDETNASRATVYRDIAFLRDALGAPIDSEGDHGFRYADDEAARFELPGLWLSSEELHALLAAHRLLDRTGPGVLDSALAPLKDRIDSLLAQQSGGKRWPIERIRVIATAVRRVNEQAFRQVATAVLERRRLGFDYRARSTDQISRRTVSPQRLTHYRDNWYLDAWDHDRDDLRSFSLDRIGTARLLDQIAEDVPDEELDRQLASSYGIFSGTPRNLAVIVFAARAARWVAEERWHSKQEGRFLPDGRYELKLPYGDSRELFMDVLRYGAEAEILAPVSLREQAKAQLQLALGQYERRDRG